MRSGPNGDRRRHQTCRIAKPAAGDGASAVNPGEVEEREQTYAPVALHAGIGKSNSAEPVMRLSPPRMLSSVSRGPSELVS